MTAKETFILSLLFQSCLFNWLFFKRIMVVMEVRKAIRSGQLCPSILNFEHEKWCQEMAKRGKWVDHSWMEMAAQYLNRDIVIIPLHPLPEGRLYHLISAGLLNGSGRGRNAPIFIGNYCIILK